MQALTFLARYPFLEEAKEWVRDRQFTIDQMLSPESEGIQRRALERVDDSIEGREIAYDVRGRSGEEVEILSYPVSRFMVAAVGDPNLIKWFSHHEGERARSLLEKEDPSRVLQIGEELGFPAIGHPPDLEPETGARREVVKGVRALDYSHEAENREYWVRFTGYLPPKRNISGPEWDLSNQAIRKGYVRLNRRTYIRMVQELVKARVEEGLYRKMELPRNSALSEMIGGLRTKVEGRKRRYSPVEMGRITITRLPPCMRQILGMSQAGENLPHHARFALVTFLNAIGMSSEEIFKVFTGVPDFKEDIVRYQVEHITGTTSATSYTTPNCDTMKTGGICFNPDTLCDKEWLINPLKYYRIKGRNRRAEEKKDQPTSR
ncbi:MAG: DNA primase large subunit PriL [Candidatus Thermoplasmatota archaeon]|nr:DNA primase large subunit PriL [Candidatus Thermoplasmatota archaeon]